LPHGGSATSTTYDASGAAEQGKDEFGGADLNDVLNRLPLIDSLPKADPSRLGMWDYSRGGLMTYLALTRTSRINAAIVLGYWADFRTIRRVGRI
jgi:dipeptidyl aminopeptidase/acylaminoacyl peptidase